MGISPRQQDKTWRTIGGPSDTTTSGKDGESKFRLATKLVPKLTPKHECTIIPKETCYLRFEQPRLERKPLKSEWCLDESGPMPEEEYKEGEDFGLSVDLRNDLIV